MVVATITVVVACSPLACGTILGFEDLRAGPDNATDGSFDASTSDVTPDTDGAPQVLKRVFVSSDQTRGNINGPKGADDLCTRTAIQAQLGGEWTAWLSTTQEAALDRLPKNGGPWYLVGDDAVVAVTSPEALATGALLKEIGRNERGEGQGGGVWTGTLPDGQAAKIDCTSWTSADANDKGLVGAAGSFDGDWTAKDNDECGQSHRLYCFQR